MSKFDKYKQFHKQLAKDFGTTEEIISTIRKLNRGGEGLNPLEAKNHLIKRISNRQEEIVKLLSNIDRDSKVIEYLKTVSTATVEEMLKIQSGIEK